MTVGYSFDAKLEHGNPMRKGAVKQPEDGRWSNYNRFALEKATVARSPIPVDDVRLPQRYRAEENRPVKTAVTVAR